MTWGLNPFSPENFVPMPRTESAAKAQGWTKEKSCDEVNGNRYMFKGDRTVLLIFNTHGDIAGIAAALPKGYFNSQTQLKNKPSGFTCR